MTACCPVCLGQLVKGGPRISSCTASSISFGYSVCLEVPILSLKVFRFDACLMS